jgi:transmembrane sensor
MSATLWTRLRHVLGSYPTTAREWAVRVHSSDVTRRELLALERWLRADPANAEAYARLNKIGHLGLMLKETPEELARLTDNPLWQKTTQPRANPAGRSALFPAAAATASLAAVAVAVYLAWSLTSGTEYVSGRGEQRQVGLVDGSRVIVNTESEVRVAFTGRERAVELARGEAFFDVAKDATRPFVVRAGHVEVRAVGTKFTVRRLEGDTQVVVTEGRVQVARADRSRAISAQQPVAIDPGHIARIGLSEQPVKVAAIDTVRATAWTTGNVEFEEATLAEVIRDVNRYTPKPFVVQDEELNLIRFTGRFHVGDTEMVKFALRDRFGISADEDDSSVRLFRR